MSVSCECRLPGSPTRYPWVFLADRHSVSTGVLPRCQGGRKDRCGACLEQLTTRQSRSQNRYFVGQGESGLGAWVTIQPSLRVCFLGTWKTLPKPGTGCLLQKTARMANTKKGKQNQTRVQELGAGLVT